MERGDSTLKFLMRNNAGKVRSRPMRILHFRVNAMNATCKNGIIQYDAILYGFSDIISIRM